MKSAASKTMMRAVRCHRFAALNDKTGQRLSKSLPIRSVLSLDSVPAPDIGDEKNVLIDCYYAGIQYPDYLQAQGLYQSKPELPYIPGMDVAGVVVQKGRDVSDDELTVGDRVYANLALSTSTPSPFGDGGIGALAEIVRVSSDSVWKIPNAVPLSSVANLGRNYFAAYHSLKVIGNVGPDDLVLITGASGGVGMASVELAKARGAQVIAGVSSLSKGTLVGGGADVVLKYGSDRDSYRKFKKDVRSAAADLGHPDGCDLIVDVVQGDLFEDALISCIRPLGKICLVGFTAGQKPIRPGLILIKEAAVVGSLWGRWAKANPIGHRENVNEILSFMTKGSIEARADTVVDVENYDRAFQLYEDNLGRGNTVIRFKAESSIFNGGGIQQSKL